MALAAGVRTGDALEKLIATLSKAEWNEASGIWQHRLNGAHKPFVKWEPRPIAPAVDIAEKLWPGTSDWFYTPVWYLLEDREYLPSEIRACAEVLPQRFRYLLISESADTSQTALGLHGIESQLPYDLAHPVTPWAAGAMACAMRRSELAGDLPVFRKCCVGLIWLLDRLIESLESWVAEPLQRFRARAMTRFSSATYPLQATSKLAISKAELNQFGLQVGVFAEEWRMLSTEMRWPR